MHNGGFTFRREEGIEKMTVACGGCLGCRLDRAKMWATRIVHEAQLYDDNCFITLTYRDVVNCTSEQLRKRQHVPLDGSLDKSHFQKFMKRLRKRFPDRKIRYYQCGEYGDQLNRPHYHACLFNLDFPDKELFKDSNGNQLFVSQTLEKLWPYGFSTIGDLTYESAAYCARYVLKKVTGPRHDDHYLRCNPDTGEAYWLVPEYTTMSRRPGIGKEWYDKFKDDVFPEDEVPVPGQGIHKKAPRYYEQIFQAEDPESHEEIKRLRRLFRVEHGEDYTPERLMDKYKVKKAQLGIYDEKKKGIIS